MSNIIRDRKADLVRAFEASLDQCAECLDEGVAKGTFTLDDIPEFMSITSFQFPKANLEITAMPEYNLKDPIPDPILRPSAQAIHG